MTTASTDGLPVDLPEGLELLKAEAERTNNAAAGRRIGYSREAVSLAINGKYPGGTTRINAAALKHLANQVDCPHLQKPIGAATCADLSSREMSTANRPAFLQWAACKNCPQKPANQETSNEHQ